MPTMPVIFFLWVCRSSHRVTINMIGARRTACRQSFPTSFNSDIIISATGTVFADPARIRGCAFHWSMAAFASRCSPHGIRH